MAWREQFTAKGIALAIIAHIFGLIFLASYLLYATYQYNGDVKGILLGKREMVSPISKVMK